jgi:hypothetical protein
MKGSGICQVHKILILLEVSIVSGYGLDDRTIQVRSPAVME